MPQSQTILALGVVAMMGPSTSANVTPPVFASKPPASSLTTIAPPPVPARGSNHATPRRAAGAWDQRVPSAPDLSCVAFAEEGKPPRILARSSASLSGRRSRSSPKRDPRHAAPLRTSGPSGGTDGQPRSRTGGEEPLLKIRAAAAGNVLLLRAQHPATPFRSGTGRRQLSGAIIVDTLGARKPLRPRCSWSGCGAAGNALRNAVEKREEVWCSTGAPGPAPSGCPTPSAIRFIGA